MNGKVFARRLIEKVFAVIDFEQLRKRFDAFVFDRVFARQVRGQHMDLRRLSEPISIADIAAALYMSRGYLCEKFKKESGSTLSDFILSAKIDEATRLLSLTDKSISAIGEYLGFSSQSLFGNTFKNTSA